MQTLRACGAKRSSMIVFDDGVRAKTVNPCGGCSGKSAFIVQQRRKKKQKKWQKNPSTTRNSEKSSVWCAPKTGMMYVVAKRVVRRVYVKCIHILYVYTYVRGDGKMIVKKSPTRIITLRIKKKKTESTDSVFGGAHFGILRQRYYTRIIPSLFIYREKASIGLIFFCTYLQIYWRFLHRIPKLVHTKSRIYSYCVTLTTRTDNIWFTAQSTRCQQVRCIFLYESRSESFSTELLLV